MNSGLVVNRSPIDAEIERTGCASSNPGESDSVGARCFGCLNCSERPSTASFGKTQGTVAVREASDGIARSILNHNSNGIGNVRNVGGRCEADRRVGWADSTGDDLNRWLGVDLYPVDGEIERTGGA